MAHFAKLDENNIVIDVIVIHDKDTSDANGIEKESIGIAFCERMFGGNWKQTSYNRNFRKHYAGIGYVYDENLDAFLPPKPYNNWILTENYDWAPPIPRPEGNSKGWMWDDENVCWVQVPIEID